VTPSVSSKGRGNATKTGKGLAEGTPSVCTPVCTSNTENVNADPLGQLAAALLALSPADRARLAAMLTGQAEAKGKRGHSTI
jgi:hypothetical protein